MARLFKTPNGTAIWWLSRCEEADFIAKYDEVSKLIPERYSWKPGFEQSYFQDNNPVKGLPQPTIDNINTVRKRRGLSPIEFIETEADDYIYNKDLDKARHRRSVREELATAKPEFREKQLEMTRAEIQLQRPPHQTYAEWRLRRDADQAAGSRGSTIERFDVLRTNAATNAAALFKPAKKEPIYLGLDKAIEMLMLVEFDGEVFDQVIERINPDDYIEFGKRIEDKELKKKIVIRALAAAA